jgi:hypothetical protein
MLSQDLATLKVLQAHRLGLIEVPRDGNCLFHSLCSFIKSKTLTAFTLRLLICKFIWENADIFSIEMADTGYTLREYLTYMQRDGMYGDGTVIQAFAMLFGINVVIFSDGSFHETLPDAEIMIALYWDRGSRHYQPAIPVD